MIFKVITPKGSELEIDTDKVQGITVEVEGKVFDIDIVEKK